MPLPAAAQALPPPQPGLIERIAPATPPALGPPLLPPAPLPATGPGAQRYVLLGAVQLAGNTALPEATLRPLVAGLAQKLVRLAEIEAARLAVLDAYRRAGFAYVAVAARLAPGEGSRAGLVMAVTEGFVSEVAVEGAAGPAEAQLRRFLAPLLRLRPLPHAALERALLLAGDIPGLTVRGLLQPAEGEPGALRLLARVSPAPLSGYASLDNRGNASTGAWQGLWLGQLNGILGAERTELALLGTDGKGQGFAQLAEEVFLGSSGLRLRGFAGAGQAEPGGSLAALGYQGATRVAGIGLALPVLRSRPRNLTLTAQLDAFESLVRLRQAGTRSTDSVRALRLGAEAEARDAVFALPATSSATLRLHRGLEALGASDGSTGTTARLGSDFGFFRVVAEASRSQPLFSPAEGWLVSAFVQGAAQWSDDALPPAEKFYLGGNRLGRGFHAGQVAGDRALAGTLELQAATGLALPWSAGPLGAQFYLFHDEARATDNASEVGPRRLAARGAGLRLQLSPRTQWEMEAVQRITRTPEGSGVRRLEEGVVFTRLLLRF
ncbi:ShlB/FhaC/HecB family hemolysin secretion/activation protein [Falsiroseomonas selenitidurans]|uniref:ShlB/FhaC/HecB family hemolysin secretion/activation protein n=1 Tax=Falsiroseomonas selenitidurans TaxID=2716335 RepID=A0ABX1DYP4_9PROT|nr:ShlB/FhaC/HecB family hemolysin secretion/activation protein [Falsiroseomonas selenitidurans]NKC29988.1 ShlB/FhaC/HecB family hemolysin secretion/activation protein [Falsiroseomonas selenitidurans]